STTTIFPVIVAGGRAVDALRSITVAQHLFGIQNIVVVHHSHCGATSFTADGIINAYEHEHHVDISKLYDRSNIRISDYEASLKHDTALVRSHGGTPENVNVFVYFYDIDTGTVTEVVRDDRRACPGRMDGVHARHSDLECHVATEREVLENCVCHRTRMAARAVTRL